MYVELQKESADQSLGFSIAGGRGSAPTFQEGDEVCAVIMTKSLTKSDWIAIYRENVDTGQFTFCVLASC